MTQTQVRVRFAPSPTGYLHLGGARTALFNWFFAKRHGGKFVLRIEDTDTERNRPEFESEILKSMAWLGMHHDEGPYRQSERFDRYRAFVDELLRAGKAYRCTCSAEEIDKMRADATAAGKKPMYDRRCRDRKTPLEGSSVVRFKTPLEGNLVIQDLIKGEVSFPLAEIDDFIILRSNNTPIYNLTVVVDDVDMKITHVIRAEEHLSNTPKQALLMQALNFKAPEYAHVPLILAPDKTKLSKRHGAVAVSQFKDEGYLPEAMINGLMRLGWSHGNQEIFSVPELEKFFDLSGCGTSGSVFDKAKLDSLNSHYIKQKPLEDLAKLIRENHGVDLSALLESDKGRKLFTALRERAVKLPDFVSGSAWYFKTPDLNTLSPDLKSLINNANPQALATLCASLKNLQSDRFKAEEIGPLVKTTAQSLGLKMPDLAKPARVLLTGTLSSPDLGLVFEVLGLEESLLRLQNLS